MQYTYITMWICMYRRSKRKRRGGGEGGCSERERQRGGGGVGEPGNEMQMECKRKCKCKLRCVWKFTRNEVEIGVKCEEIFEVNAANRGRLEGYRLSR